MSAMASISGAWCSAGLLLILVLCSFTEGRSVVTAGEVIARVRGSGGGSGGGGTVVDAAKSSRRPEANRVDLVARELVSVKRKGGAAGANETTVDASHRSDSRRAGSPPPPAKAHNNTPPATVTVGPASPAQEDASTGDEAKASPAHSGTCTQENGPVIASLAASGDDGDHEYTLVVENGGGKSQLEVTIKTSSGLKADPTQGFKLKKGETKSVTISVIDKEAAALSARINISWGEGDCYVEIAPEHMGGSLAHPSYLSLLSAQGPFAILLGGTLVFVLILGVMGVWGCVTWRAHARRHGDAEAKYQELEMTLPAAVSKQDDGMSPSADGWDEVWEDDDWQDTEAVRSSSTSLTLSANGLNSRRANKDGWDNSWDD